MKSELSLDQWFLIFPASEPPGALVKIHIAQLPLGLEWGLTICISNWFSGDAVVMEPHFEDHSAGHLRRED